MMDIGFYKNIPNAEYHQGPEWGLAYSRSVLVLAKDFSPAHVQAKDILNSRRDALTKLSEILLKRETIEKEQFERLLDGASEQEVFGSEAPPPKELPALQDTPAERPGREAPRPLPRPGFGTAD